MKNKHSWENLLRWVGAPLLLAGLIAWVATPAYPGNAATGEASPATLKQAGRATPAIAASTNNAALLEINDRIKELEVRERQNYSLELDGQRKQVDWWLTAMGILAAIMAIAGGLIPYLMARKDKEIIEQDKTQIKQLLAEIKGMKVDAESSIEEIHRHEADAKATKETLLSFQSGTPSSSDKEVQDAVEKIEQDKTADPLLRLRAEAVGASKPESAGKAYTLWAALGELAQRDASAQFNAGYWAYELGNSTQGAEKLHWLRLAGKHYAQALSLKPDKHEAANNWGGALLSEVNAIAESDPAYAKQLLDQAEQLLHAHADAAPAVVAYNLACVYGLRADVPGCLKWLRVSHEHKKLPDCAHLRDDKDLAAVRESPEFVAWLAAVCDDLNVQGST